MVWDTTKLEALHARLVSQIRIGSLNLPESDLAQVSDEYRGFMANTGGLGGYYQWLALLVAETQPRVVVELGSYRGASAIMLLSTLPQDSRLICVDIVDDLRFLTPKHRSDPRLTIHIGDDLAPSIYTLVPPEVDLLYIDTEHRLSQLQAEWEIYSARLRPDALVVLDDIQLNDMHQFWESLSFPKLDVSRECHYSGFGVFAFSDPQLVVPDVAASA